MKIKAALLLLLCFVVTSCKKGEDDPAFSLKSRASRLHGVWVLKSAKVEGKYDQPGERSSDFVFISDGAKFTLDFADTSAVNVSGPHKLLLDIQKKGEMEVRETFFSEGYELKGTWDFLRKNGDSKNKEDIMFVPVDVINGSTSDFHPLFYPSMERTYHLRELRDDKLVIVYEGKPYIQRGGETLNLKAEFLFGR
jgi:hypothetical protein